MTRRIVSSAYRWHIAARILVATVMGYLLTNLVAIFLTLAWPGQKINAAISMTSFSFLLYTAIVMWVFSVTLLREIFIALLFCCVSTSSAVVALYLMSTV